MHEAFLAEAPSPWSLVLVAVALCLLVLFSLWINGAVGRSTPAGRVQSLVSLKNKLSKVPDHLAVAYDGDDKQGLDHLLCWAWFCNIRRVTVFDSKGYFKSNQAEVLLAATSCAALYFPDMKFSTPPFTSRANPVSSSSKNALPQLVVEFVGPQDGRPKLAKVAQALCASTSQQRLRSEEITTEYVDAILRQERPSEPQLMLYCSTRPYGVVHLGDYPPWELRLTEIFHASSRGRIEFDDYVRALKRFSHCEQRFGK